MASFLGKLRSGNDTKNAASAPPKKDPNAPQPTPLERMLENAGPIRNDGSDKFFGMENFGNTCYCNSILQCLYYTPPFRENVLSYPQRSTPEALATAAATATPRPTYRLQNGVLTKPGQPPPTKTVLTTANQPGQKPDDKESPEYKKKLALAAGPVVNMTYQNAAGYDMPESMFTSLKDIFEAITVEKNRHGVVSPVRFLEVLRRENEMFRSAMHQDAHEFLNLLLNSVIDGIEDHEKKQEASKKELEHPGENGDAVKPANNAVSWPSTLPLAPSNSRTKWLRQMFEGTSTSETRCLTCETVSQRDEPFLDLSVDLEQHSSVTACLNRFSEEEMLCERNKFHCDNCGGLQEAEKRMKIKRLPQILALHLKRFKYTEDLARLQKLHHKVVYPYHLRLFNTTYDAEDPDRLYELYAVVVHIGGGPYHGHYVAIIKTQDRGWLLFDDEMVEPVDRSYVKNFFGDKSGLATAYVLFYRQTTQEDMNRELRMEGKRRASQDLGTDTTTRVKESAEIHRVYSAGSSLSPLDTKTFGNLDSTLASAHNATNGHIEAPKSPTTAGPMPSSPLQTKKEKVKEEKERKAAEKANEKEREKAEKQRKKDLESKMKEVSKKQSDELKSAIDASKTSKEEEDKRNGNTEHASKENSPLSSLASRDIFRRSKSLRFGSLGRKDKPTSNPEDANNTVEEEGSNTNGNVKEKDKRNRFSIRKKSFGML